MTGEEDKQQETAGVEPELAGDSVRRLWPVVRRLPAYIRLAWGLLRDPALTGCDKAPLIAAVTYCVTPLHWPANAVPVLGQIDTPLALLLALRYTLNHCSLELAETHLGRRGMRPGQIEEDISTVARVAGALPRKAAGQIRFAGILVRVAGRRARRKLIEFRHLP